MKERIMGALIVLGKSSINGYDEKAELLVKLIHDYLYDKWTEYYLENNVTYCKENAISFSEWLVNNDD